MAKTPVIEELFRESFFMTGVFFIIRTEKMITCKDILKLNLDGMALIAGENGLDRVVSWTYLYNDPQFLEGRQPKLVIKSSAEKSEIQFVKK